MGDPVGYLHSAVSATLLSRICAVRTVIISKVVSKSNVSVNKSGQTHELTDTSSFSGCKCYEKDIGRSQL